ncbi:hypothetical protein CPB85DRAFT_642770 [Mucidula mucida]|nr:hypothetical protein CPB85DRAFT_642770 [Mucidula mucida]
MDGRGRPYASWVIFGYRHLWRSAHRARRIQHHHQGRETCFSICPERAMQHHILFSPFSQLPTILRDGQHHPETPQGAGRFDPDLFTLPPSDPPVGMSDTVLHQSMQLKPLTSSSKNTFIPQVFSLGLIFCALHSTRRGPISRLHYAPPLRSCILLGIVPYST